MKRIILYSLAVYALVIGFGIYLKTAFGEEGFPHISRTDSPKAIEPARSCREYLNICESSCSHRGEMFRFLCLGQNFNPEMGRYLCQCGDDAMYRTAQHHGEKEEVKKP